MEMLQKSWQKTCKSFCTCYGSAVFESWIKPLDIASFDSGVVTINAPTRFIKNWVKGHYLEYIEDSLKEDFTNILAVEIVVNAKSISESVSSEEVSSLQNKTSNNNSSNNLESNATNIISKSYSFDKKLKFNNYVSGEANEFAYKLSKKFASEENLESEFNPLVITGSVGLGKTHLLCSIANEAVLKKPNLNVVYLTAERFMFKFIKALNENNILDFKQEVRSAELLLIDDLQFMCGKKSVQEEFFHALNHLISSNCKIAIACDRQISQLHDMDERIKSRLNSGISAEITKPDLDLKKKIIKKKLANKNFILADDVVELIANNVNSNIRELEGAVHKLVVKSQMLGINIDLALAENWLDGFFRDEEKIISVEKIKQVVADKFNIKISDIESSSRKRNFARPRQIAMYLSKKMTTRSFPEIGRKFGKRDHSTVMHAVKSIEALSTTDQELNQNIKEISSLLEA